jgi:predicted DCC family thiol-disulfide oxidoreductase YuxK
MADSAAPVVVFYDGQCGLCHGFVRFLLARDASGDNFAFAPLQGRYFATAIPESERAGVPDSVVVKATGGKLLAKSAAVLFLLRRLGRGYRLLARVLEMVPGSLLDLCYDVVASLRRKLFARPADVCPTMAPNWRRRFYL